MKPLRYTASALALGLALMANAQAVTTIPFWHSMEGELGKEVDSLAQRFNAENPDYKIVPTYKGNYEQNLSAGIAAFRTGNAPAILQVYEVGTATMMRRKPLNRCMTYLKRQGFNSMSRSLCRRFPVTTPTAKLGTYFPSRSTVRPPFSITTKTPSRKQD